MADLINGLLGYMKDPRRSQQMQGLAGLLTSANDRARAFNQLNREATDEFLQTKDIYGPKAQQVASVLANAYNPIGLTVFHGSPAKFSKFDPTKIGSGEGAQAYGYGHYVAQSPEVAKQYSKLIQKPVNSLAAEDALKTANPDLFQKLLEATGNDKYSGNAGKAFMNPNEFKLEPELKKEVLNFKKNSANFYEIDLPDEQIAKMISWDKPIKEQSKEIQDVAKSLGLEMDDLGGDIIARIDAKRPEGAEKLRQAGIPGIQYYDAQSRGGQPATTQNFVVFPGNEDLLTILKRNGGLLD
jgi:hypothetical protein